MTDQAALLKILRHTFPALLAFDVDDEPKSKDDAVSRKKLAITSYIALFSNYNLTVVFKCSESLALRVAEAMFQDTYNSFNDDVKYAVA